MFFYGVDFCIFLNLHHCLCFSYNFRFLYSLVFFVLAFTMRAMFTVYWPVFSAKLYEVIS